MLGCNSRVEIPLNKLKKLYIHARYSTADIAKVYGCNPETVRRHLIEANVRRRNPYAKKYAFSLDEIRRMYEIDKLSMFEIARKYGCSQWVIRERLSKGQASLRKSTDFLEWRCPGNSAIPDLRPSKVLSYVLGVIFGDGSVYSFKDNYSVSLDSANVEFCREFLIALKNIGLNPCMFKRRKRAIWRTVATSKILCTWVKRLGRSDLRSIVTQLPKEFIKGFYESEGCAYQSIDGESKKNKKYWHLVIVNTDEELIKLTKQLLELERYKPTLSESKPTRWKPVWRLCILKQADVFRFFEEIRPCIKNPYSGRFINTKYRSDA